MINVNNILGNNGSSVGRGHWEDMTSSWPVHWTQILGGSLPPPLSLECVFLPLFPHSSCFKDTALRCWHHMNWIHDWASLRLLCKLLRFWLAGAEIYPSFSCPRQASYVSFLAYLNCHLPTWSGLSLCSASPCPLWTGASFKFHLGNSQGFEATSEHCICHTNFPLVKFPRNWS